MHVSLLTERVQVSTKSKLTLVQGNMKGLVLRWRYACVDLIKRNMQHNHPGTWACVQVLPRPSGLLYLHHWLLPQWDGAGFGTALSLLTLICSQPQTSNHTSHSSLSVHLSLRNTYAYSLFLCVSVAWFRVLPQWPASRRHQRCRLSPSFTRGCTAVSSVTQTYARQTHCLHLCKSHSHAHMKLQCSSESFQSKTAWTCTSVSAHRS